VFTALLCYAKITPAPLHRSDFVLTTIAGGEAAGGRPEFALSDFRRISAGLALRARKCCRWHQVKQGLPDA